MNIEHIAIWTTDIERLRDFYCRYFGAQSGEKYVNPKKNFTSYFLSFDTGARLEVMNVPDVVNSDAEQPNRLVGLAHFAVSVGSKSRVDVLTEQLRHNGFIVAGEPRTTGDGYYESVVLDPDGNHIEITV